MILLLKKQFIKLVEFVISKNFFFFLNLYFYSLKIKFIRYQFNYDGNNIAILNTHDLTGGASKIAYQLSQFVNSNFDCFYFVKFKMKGGDNIYEIPSLKDSLVINVLKKVSKKEGWLDISSFDAINLLSDKRFKKSKVIHLHNLYENFCSPLLFSFLFKKKKVIWTLHDEGVLTGHCSCTLGCEKWKEGCGECPDLSIYPKVESDNTKINLLIKKQMVNKLNPIIVCPSYWLEKRVKIAYPQLSNIQVIPNGIDTNIYKPMNKVNLRAKLGLPLDKKIILFVAEYSTNNPFKGGDIIRSLINELSNYNIQFVTVGGTSEMTIENLTSFGYISNEIELAEIYSASDLMVYPTKADNLPLVVLEAMGAGTPVIASNVGGVSEIIIDKVNGFLIDNYFDYSKFKENILLYFNFSEKEQMLISEMARQRIVNDFDKEKMIQNYSNLYKTCFEFSN